jgi:hypothetical protein
VFSSFLIRILKGAKVVKNQQVLGSTNAEIYRVLTTKKPAASTAGLSGNYHTLLKTG